MSKLNVAIIGTGFISKKRHIPGFLKLKNKVNVVAVCDIAEEVARDVATKYNIPNVYSDVSDLLKKETLDIVDICTPPKTHAPITIQCLEENNWNITESARKLGIERTNLHRKMRQYGIKREAR